MTAFEKCHNCGAPLEAAADGRSVHCVYCGSTEGRAVDPARLAAALRAESGSVERLLESLAERLGRELPDLAKVGRRGGLFSAKKIDSLEVTFEDRVFRLRQSLGRLNAELSEVVRGIVVKTRTLEMDAWLEELCEALSDHASSSAKTHDALKRLSG